MDILGCWGCVGNIPWCLPLAGWGLGWIGNDCGLVFVGVEVGGWVLWIVFWIWICACGCG